MSQEEIHIKTPLQEHNLEDGIITFSINYMKCRTVAVMYYVLHCYNYDGVEILKESQPFHVGERWAIDETWSSYQDSFELAAEELSEIFKIQIELVLINVNDDNPLVFSEVMLQNGEYEEYHEPNEVIREAVIGFINNAYVNLYSNSNDNYLQVIRPYKDPLTTLNLSKSNCTVLAPHITNEPTVDKPENLFIEFMNQSEQVTNIKPI